MVVLQVFDEATRHHDVHEETSWETGPWILLDTQFEIPVEGTTMKFHIICTRDKPLVAVLRPSLGHGELSQDDQFISTTHVIVEKYLSTSDRNPASNCLSASATKMGEGS